jgi:PAS domain S-box-containing protein
MLLEFLWWLKQVPRSRRGVDWLRAGLVLAGVPWLAPTGWALDPAQRADGYSIAGWFTEDGLPSSKIRAVFQARDGYLWLVTEQGLARFDGSRFTVFTQESNPELLSSYFMDGCEGPDGSRWFSGNTGIYRWVGSRFERFGVTQGLPSDYVRSLSLAPDGAVLAGTNHGYRFVRDGQVVGRPQAAADDNLLSTVFCFRQTADGNRWIGSATGLWRLVGERLEKAAESPGNALVYGLLVLPDGGFLIGSSAGLRRVHPDGRVEDIGQNAELKGRQVQCLLRDRHDNIWIGTSAGLFRLSQGRIAAALYERLGAGTIVGLCEDHEGAIWVGSNVGLFRLKDTAFSGIGATGGANQLSAYPVMEVRDGSWWFGTFGSGVYRYDRGQVAPVPMTASFVDRRVYCLEQDTSGRVWVGSTSGLFAVAEDGSSTDYTVRSELGAWQKKLAANPRLPLPGIVHLRVNSMAPDAQGGMWIGTVGALYHASEGQFHAYTTADGLPSYFIRYVLCARDGDVWITTPPDGLIRPENTVARLHQGRWTVFGAKEGLAYEYVRALYEDSTGAIWVTTDGRGLRRFKDGVWHAYSVEEGLSDNRIAGIVEDNLGFLWIGSPLGLMRIARQEFDDLDAGRSPRLHSRLFNRSDGMLHTECNPPSSPSMWKTRDGHILVATEVGVIVVGPTAVAFNRLPPPVHVEHLAVNGAEVDISRPVSIAPGSRDFEIRYTAVSLLAPEKVRFKVMLQPLDAGWVDQEGRRDIRYPRLPPGDYTFSVIGSNNDGVWNETGASLAFTVRPFFYQTVWFRALLVLAAFGGIAAVVSWRLRKLRLRSAELKRQNVELEHRIAERTAELAKSYEALRSSEYFYHSLVESLPQIIVRKDAESRFTYANDAFGELLGQPVAQLIGKSDRDFYPPEQAAKFLEDDVRLMRSGQTLEYENVVEKTGQKKRYLHVKKVPLYDAQRQPMGVQLLFWDMTVFRETEEQLRLAQKELIETSRLAGIAEVATGVLHNLGNALNSVNTSAALALERLRKSKLPSVRKAAQLLLQQGDRLGEFFATDPRGRQLPGYLDQLAEHLQTERSEAIQELEALQHSIDHIKEIVAAQQSFAHVSGIVEIVPPAEIVEYALRISETSLTRHGVTVVREFSPAPAVKVERQKVLQVLVNLIRNAKEAMNEYRQSDKRLVLGVRVAPAGAVQIYAIDNGVGIAPENLTRIFAFGYTTKVTGHGFGLHSSANAAKEMGGSLVAHSEGPGKGATFILELPPADPASTPTA